MNNPETYSRLVASVTRILKFIEQNKNSPTLLHLVNDKDAILVRPTATLLEMRHRQKSLQEFQKLPRYQKIFPQLYNNLVKSLYPATNGLSRLLPSVFIKNEVNHSSLYKCYSELPSPGAGHLQGKDLEEFMKQIFHNRVFAKPNVLSTGTFDLYHDKFLLRQYSNAIEYRRDHLRKLWHITKDMDDANIPLTDYERRQMIFMTFYKDRPDIVLRIESIASQTINRVQKSDPIQKSDLRLQTPKFDWTTYIDLVKLDPDARLNVALQNTLLFCALRHGNWRVEQDILKHMHPETFSRSTYKILLDNHAMHRRLESFEVHLNALTSLHLHLVDINLLNIIIRSLSNFGYTELCEMLIAPFLEESGDLSSHDSFLKLVTFQDKLKYSAYIDAYDQKKATEPMRICATEKSFLPLLSNYLQAGKDFYHVAKLLYCIEVVWQLPLSSHAFTLLFHSFTVRQGNPKHLQLITQKLIELHDRYYAKGDSWIRERINETSIPPSASKLLLDILDDSEQKYVGTQGGVYLKLSNGLVRLVFKAYRTTFKSDSAKMQKIDRIEADLQRRLLDAKNHAPLCVGGALKPADLNLREEQTYLKKSSLLELLDLE